LSIWTPAEIDTLRKRRREGVTFKAIGEELGRSRSAVIGKWFGTGSRGPRKPAKPVVGLKTPGLGGPVWSRPQ
jgi:hypothetical protein